VPATITAIEEGIVIVDLNHPLAGKRLNFKIKLSGIKPS
jgi:FKBP-type peptidyl-prolyl cis-trans isomerase 2